MNTARKYGAAHRLTLTLTPRQQQVLDTIHAYAAEHNGQTPSCAEVARRLGAKDVRGILEVLANKNRIRVEGGIRLLKVAS